MVTKGSTPKRPLNVFMLFARQRRSKIGGQVADSSKILAKEWKEMGMVQAGVEPYAEPESQRVAQELMPTTVTYTTVVKDSHPRAKAVDCGWRIIKGRSNTDLKIPIHMREILASGKLTKSGNNFRKRHLLNEYHVYADVHWPASVRVQPMRNPGKIPEREYDQAAGRWGPGKRGPGRRVLSTLESRDAQIHGTVAVTCEWTTGQRTEPFILLVQRDLVDIPEAADPDPQVAGTVQTILGSEDGIHFRASYMGYHGGAIELAGEGFALSCLAAAQERV
ncbi:hypothetical protein B0H13DRAFT_1855622 [Mycena leptocephala]|nr:hypothetical protein B0H13DRAFT_1855622 [Mycena leptocephala]